MTQTYDAVIIGTGQAAPSLARRLAGAGMRVAVAERKFFGGTCVNTGCIPTKALVASAHVAQLMRRAHEFGVPLNGPVEVDMKAVKARMDAITERSRNGIGRSLEETEGCTVYRGHARFVSAREVAVGDDVLRARKMFINVGARAKVPPIEGLDEVPYLTNSSILDLEEVPPRLIVLGGSYIGLEFAQVYRRFGSEVTVIEAKPRLIAQEDEDVSEAVAEILGEEGVRLVLGAEDLAFERKGDAILARSRSGGRDHEIAGSHLLIAVGRQPNTEDLGLDKAGVAVDERGYIKVDDQLATSATGIWALGECNGRGAFTHTAYNDGEIVAANLLDGASRRVSDRILAYGLYIDPPLGRAGMTEEEVRQAGIPALIHKLPMDSVSRASLKGDTRGFMKLVAAQHSQEILGAAILGVGGDEAIHAILDLMYAGAPYTTLAKAVHIHPTVSEYLQTMATSLEPMTPAGSDRIARR